MLIFILAKDFTKQSFDMICNSLSPDDMINPHKSFFGIGNYDVNCIMKALEMKNYDLIWYDKRRELTEQSLELSKAFGFIMNFPSDYTLGFISLPLIRSRHWVAIRKINGDYYNLDSKLSKPKLIGTTDEDFLTYLKTEMSSNDKELFIVVPKS